MKKVIQQIAAIEPNAFAGQKAKPTDKALASVLGPTVSLWKRTIQEMKRDLKIDAAEWHTGSVKYGWSYRLQLKKRNIVYLGPRQGWFMAGFALGDTAVEKARKSDLPADTIKIIDESKRYVEGTAVSIQVRTPDDINVVKQLAKIKIEN
jgi:Protein of unknown function (DUF3788)